MSTSALSQSARLAERTITPDIFISMMNGVCIPGWGQSPFAQKGSDPVLFLGLAVFDGDPGLQVGADVFGRRADQLVVGALFHDVGRPACDTRANENWR